MDWKKFGIISAVTFVVGSAVEVGGGMLYYGADLTADKSLPWSAQPIGGWGVIVLIAVVASLTFTYIFLKGYEGKGAIEGVRYGILITLLASFVPNVGLTTLLPVSHTIATKLIVVDLVNFVACGMLAAMIAGKSGQTAGANAR